MLRREKMKRISFLSLVLLYSLLFTTIVLATTDNIDDPLAPLSPETVTNRQYEEFDEPQIPQSPPDADEEYYGKLPQTGGIPAEVFYIAGGICVLSGALLLTGKSKSKVSNNHINTESNKKP